MPPQDEKTVTDTKPVQRPALNRNLVMVGLGGLVLGLVIGLSISRMPKTALAPTSSTPTGITVSQTGVTQGKLIKISSSTMTVQDDKGQSVEVSVGTNVNIYVYKDRVNPPMLVTDLSQVSVGREVRVNVVMQNGQFVATTVTVLPDVNAGATPTASASSSAIRKNP